MNSNRAHLAPADAADGCSIITLIPAAPCWAWPWSSSKRRRRRRKKKKKKRQRDRESHHPVGDGNWTWAFAFWLTSGLAAHPWMTPSLLSPSLSICRHLNLPYLPVPWLGLLSLPYPLPFTFLLTSSKLFFSRVILPLRLTFQPYSLLYLSSQSPSVEGRKRLPAFVLFFRATHLPTGQFVPLSILAARSFFWLLLILGCTAH